MSLNTHKHTHALTRTLKHTHTRTYTHSQTHEISFVGFNQQSQKNLQKFLVILRKLFVLQRLAERKHNRSVVGQQTSHRFHQHFTPAFFVQNLGAKKLQSLKISRKSCALTFV